MPTEVNTVTPETDTCLAPLGAREVCQVLREVTFERRVMVKVDANDAGRVVVDIDGWIVTLQLEGNALEHCAGCICPDGRRWVLDAGDRYGTDPVALLSTWELACLGRWLARLTEVRPT